MFLNFKYRLFPTKAQQLVLDEQFFVSNQAWNYALNLRIKDLKNKSGFTKSTQIEKYVKTKLTVRNINYKTAVLQTSVQNLDKTLQKFFKQKGKSNEIGFPQFKSSNFIQQSFEFRNQGIQITQDYFQIFRMKIKWTYHRELPSNPKKVVIKREADGNYFVIFSVEVEESVAEKTGVNAAIDLNIKNIAIATSNGESYLRAIKKMTKYSKKYAKIQKKLSIRYEKKSKTKNTKKLQIKQNKIHAKVKRVKEDFFHKLSNELVKNFDKITVENLDIKKMIEGDIRRLRKDISIVSWDSLIQKLKYKCQRYGKVFEEINPAYTSQRCNICGYISKKNRTSQSKFLCKSCGHSDNADENAAKNILDYEHWFQEQATRWDARHTESS